MRARPLRATSTSRTTARRGMRGCWSTLAKTGRRAAAAAPPPPCNGPATEESGCVSLWMCVAPANSDSRACTHACTSLCALHACRPRRRVVVGLTILPPLLYDFARVGDPRNQPAAAHAGHRRPGQQRGHQQPGSEDWRPRIGRLQAYAHRRRRAGATARIAELCVYDVHRPPHLRLRRHSWMRASMPLLRALLSCVSSPRAREHHLHCQP